MWEGNASCQSRMSGRSSGALPSSRAAICDAAKRYAVIDDKYSKRPGPPYPAQACPGLKRKGNDGAQYTSRRVGRSGSFRWMKDSATIHSTQTVLSEHEAKTYALHHLKLLKARFLKKSMPKASKGSNAAAKPKKATPKPKKAAAKPKKAAAKPQKATPKPKKASPKPKKATAASRVSASQAKEAALKKHLKKETAAAKRAAKQARALKQKLSKVVKRTADLRRQAAKKGATKRA